MDPRRPGRLLRAPALLDGTPGRPALQPAAGLVGRITKVDTSYVTLEVSGGDKPTEMVMQRSAVQTLLPKGTMKDLL